MKQTKLILIFMLVLALTATVGMQAFASDGYTLAVGENTVYISIDVYYAFTPEESGMYMFTSESSDTDPYVLILDENGTIEQVNPACENLIGLVNNKIIKSSIDEFLFSKKTFISKELHKVEENELFLRDFYIKNPLSNNIVPVEISFARINPDDDFKRFVGVTRDVTEQK